MIAKFLFKSLGMDCKAFLVDLAFPLVLDEEKAVAILVREFTGKIITDSRV